MAYTTGTASSYTDLLDKLRRFACGYGTLGTVTPGGGNVGNGTLTGLDTFPATVTETWTLTCTAGGATGTFSVVGSVSGAQASATVGTPYTNTFITFTLNDGTVDFSVGDSFTFAATRGATKTAGEEWEQQRWTGGNELILKGLGLSRDKAIYVGIRAFLDGADSYQWEHRGMTGYNSAVTGLAGQPGASSAVYTHYHGSAMTYWFFVNGQRVMWFAKVSTTYQAGYLGFLLPYATPTQYPYPLVIGGTSNSSTRRWSDTLNGHSSFFDPGVGALLLRMVDGTWKEFRNHTTSITGPGSINAHVWPYWYGDEFDAIDELVGGGYALLPLIPYASASDAAPIIAGELDGVHFVTGKGNASENTITVGSDTYLVFQNVFRNGYLDFCAVKQG